MLPCIPFLLDEIRLDIHQTCNLIAVLVNVVSIKYRFVSWIKLEHNLFECMDISNQNLLLQWILHFFDVLDRRHRMPLINYPNQKGILYVSTNTSLIFSLSHIIFGCQLYHTIISFTNIARQIINTMTYPSLIGEDNASSYLIRPLMNWIVFNKYMRKMSCFLSSYLR